MIKPMFLRCFLKLAKSSKNTHHCHPASSAIFVVYIRISDLCSYCSSATHSTVMGNNNWRHSIRRQFIVLSSHEEKWASGHKPPRKNERDYWLQIAAVIPSLHFPSTPTRVLFNNTNGFVSLSLLVVLQHATNKLGGANTRLTPVISTHGRL